MITDIADRSSLVRRSALLAWFAIGLEHDRRAWSPSPPQPGAGVG
jgi:hypothetical protein